MEFIIPLGLAGVLSITGIAWAKAISKTPEVSKADREAWPIISVK